MNFLSTQPTHTLSLSQVVKREEAVVRHGLHFTHYALVYFANHGGKKGRRERESEAEGKILE